MTITQPTPYETVITYTDDEWDFIESLDEKSQKNIKRGLLTPYDLGYKPKLD